ncbi:non-hydrolyzing UDP-N-acetylglucosamine 2-epimerase [Streptomyces sulphureus]|uniref:non-hydrolyzing UDP-N-acetylglucosamine 2-epimerase n=1 Tax=Streptomyces sulphureus TaxID=47758 RepID=UPI00035D1D1F|nr:UDP-N-acetylglucosamine 2-epimerase (non-hydrolyzing) [Streptomyces sulphureus]
MKRVCVVLGTRPEAIKFAPIIRLLKRDKRFDPVIVSTGQHKEMLAETLMAFGLSVDIDLQIMRTRQTLSGATARILEGLDAYLPSSKADVLLVHGDTATTLAGALAGFHHRIPVVHVEAGLRSGTLSSPFPEEGNRRLVARIADLHLAPTWGNRDNLLREGLPATKITVTGNTVIDGLRWGAQNATGWDRTELADLDTDSRRVILASAHRRDAWPRLGQIAKAWKTLADRSDVRLVIPLHRNPAVREAILPVLNGHPNITVTEPLPYLAFCRLLDRADLIISDSSGAQEEGPALGTPTLVLSEVSERVEGVEAGSVRLVGTDTDGIVHAASSLLDDDFEYDAMARAHNPYGDGHAADRSVAALAHWFGLGPAPTLFAPDTPLLVPGLGADLVRNAS